MSGNGLVQVAFLHKDHLSYSFHDSMRKLIRHDTEGPRRLNKGGEPLNIRCHTGQLVPSRNFAVQLFLDKTDAEWLWFIDTDMGFAPDTVDRLLEAADPDRRKVVGALCFAQHYDGYDDMGGLRTRIVPTLYKIGRETESGHISFTWFGEYQRDQIYQVAATGMACIIMHRSALERVRANHGDCWFDQIRVDSGNLIGEDFSLCTRFNREKIPVHVHTGIRTTHHKEVWLAEDDYVNQYLADHADNATDPAATYVPPALDEVAVLVPVMRRPHRAEPFMQSLRATTGLARAYAVADADDLDTIAAWKAAGATVLTGVWDEPGGTFAQKLNAGYQGTREPWMFLVGDDVRFHPGWLDRAQYMAQATGAKVVGVNDLGNERTRKGEHATQVLVARDYVDEQGASWDGPGVFCHDGYGHWFVDDEIVVAAKQRQTFALALDAVVEHLHPLFGKAEMDEVYTLGQQRIEADRALFAARLAQYGADQEPAIR